MSFLTASSFLFKQDSKQKQPALESRSSAVLAEVIRTAREKDDLRKVLRLPPSHRTIDQVFVINKYVGRILQAALDITAEEASTLCRALHYRIYDTDELVFLQGDVATILCYFVRFRAYHGARRTCW